MHSDRIHPFLVLFNSYIVDSTQPVSISYIWNFGSLIKYSLNKLIRFNYWYFVTVLAVVCFIMIIDYFNMYPFYIIWAVLRFLVFDVGYFILIAHNLIIATILVLSVIGFNNVKWFLLFIIKSLSKIIIYLIKWLIKIIAYLIYLALFLFTLYYMFFSWFILIKGFWFLQVLEDLGLYANYVNLLDLVNFIYTPARGWPEAILVEAEGLIFEYLNVYSDFIIIIKNILTSFYINNLALQSIEFNSELGLISLATTSVISCNTVTDVSIDLSLIKISDVIHQSQLPEGINFDQLPLVNLDNVSFINVKLDNYLDGINQSSNAMYSDIYPKELLNYIESIKSSKVTHFCRVLQDSIDSTIYTLVLPDNNLFMDISAGDPKLKELSNVAGIYSIFNPETGDLYARIF